MMSQLTTQRRPSPTGHAPGITAGVRSKCRPGEDAAPSPATLQPRPRTGDATFSTHRERDEPTSRDSFILGLISGAAGVIVAIAVIVILALSNGAS